ncbi:type IV pilus biogenesis factor PilY1 [Comamonas phosphati]|nr:type IV pilus biogenesis factor PilY1 [Comamonas phosphati]
MHGNKLPRLSQVLLALAAAPAAPASWALDLAQSPPGTRQPHVAPNVIISVDDSGSMDYRLDAETATGATDNETPAADGSWPATSRRINVLRHALIGHGGVGGVVRDTALLPDGKIRLAWQSMNANNGTPGHLNSSATAAQAGSNSMQVLGPAHRTRFIEFVTQLRPGGGTPSHKLLQQADAYMRLPLSRDGPWAAVPGSTGAPYLGCRRNYHVMLTDGRWNGATSGGSQDDNSVNRTLPNGMAYGSANASSRPYNQLYHDSYGNTLADWAFHSWAAPLQPPGDLVGTMQPAADYRQAPPTESFGRDATNREAVLERFWNPRYNPATWPHMATYTIGLGTNAGSWPGAGALAAPTRQSPFGYDGSFPDLVTGRQQWPDMGASEDVRALDLWHAALNGRGRFYSVTKAEDLALAFRDIVGQISVQAAPELASTAASGASSARMAVGKFTAAYEPMNAWKGFITATAVQADGSTVPLPGWGGKSTADKLDALDSVDGRLVLSWSDQWSGAGYKGGVPFRWDGGEAYLSAAQKALLSQNRLDYLRGDRRLEGSDTAGYTAAKPLRERKSRQGDIIGSAIWYTGAPAGNHALNGYAAFMRSHTTRAAMLYAGGNDGMLHGFAAADGSEKIAYVPRGVLPTLGRLADPQFNSKHLYFVDGSPMTGDVDLGTGGAADWRTLLVGTLGAGGKGYFVLDVSHPAGFSESSARQLARLDRSRGATEPAPDCARSGMGSAEKTACAKAAEEDRDIGHITALPVRDEDNPLHTTQIARLNDDRWAAVLGNGYNSANQRPVLLIQYLDGAMELKRMAATSDTAGTGKAADNGLAAPRLLDLNGDGRPDVVYAGDNQGHLWKFDLTGASSELWGVAFGGQPLFTATGPAAMDAAGIGGAARPHIQPITAAPSVRANDRLMTVGSGAGAKSVPMGGMMVAFGTGRNITPDDPSSVLVQTLYAVLDNTRYRLVDTARGQRLQVHPGDSGCTAPVAGCIPAPRALGEGVARARLAEQAITEIGSGATVGARHAHSALNRNTWADFNGWYLDLPAVGERLLKPMEFYDGSNILAVYTQVPAKGSNADAGRESCDSAAVDQERQYRTLINIMDGARPSVQIVDQNGDGLLDASDLQVSRTQVSRGSHLLIARKGKAMDIDAGNRSELLARMPEQSLRPSWRQLK